MSDAFPFVRFSSLEKTHRKAIKVGNNILILRKKLTENVNKSGIENCGTDFMLEDMGKGNFKFSRRWAWLFRQYIWASRVPNMPRSNKARVMDIGCDVGEIRKLISRAFYTRNPEYVGIDIDHERLRKGADKIQFRSPAVYIQHDITLGMEFIRSSSVDVIYFGETIEHFEKIHGVWVLSEIYRVLKRGGRLCISTPNKKESKGYDFHVYEYAIKELKDELKKIGFTIDKVYGWQTTEKLINSKKRRLIDPKSTSRGITTDFLYSVLKENVHKDLAVPIMAFLMPEQSDAFCVEAIK